MKMEEEQHFTDLSLFDRSQNYMEMGAYLPR